MLDKWRMLDGLRQRIAYLRRAEMEKRETDPERADIYRERRQELELVVQQIESGAYDPFNGDGDQM